MAQKIGWRGITKHDLELLRKDVNRHERILREMLCLLEKQNKEIEKIRKTASRK